MKHITLFENWTSSVTNDVTVNYGDKKPEPELSDVVKFTEEYIEDNFDRIASVNLDYLTVEFYKRDIEYKKIMISKTKQNIYFTYKITFSELGEQESNIEITEEEYLYLNNVIYLLYKKFRKKAETHRLDTILDKIDPTKRVAKKLIYNET